MALLTMNSFSTPEDCATCEMHQFWEISMIWSELNSIIICISITTWNFTPEWIKGVGEVLEISFSRDSCYMYNWSQYFTKLEILRLLDNSMIRIFQWILSCHQTIYNSCRQWSKEASLIANLYFHSRLLAIYSLPQKAIRIHFMLWCLFGCQLS